MSEFCRTHRFTLRTHRIGPTVWLELGPTPIEKRSKVEITACSDFCEYPGLADAKRAGRPDVGPTPDVGLRVD